MTLNRIFKKFIEGWRNKLVSWYRRAYKEVEIDHPEVTSHFKELTVAVERPFCVYEDLKRSDRYCYYNVFSGDHKYPNMHMKVVIEESYFGKLRVITAYFDSNIKESNSGKLLWSRKN
ncbi:MAG TPA: hypothetical protein ENI63_01625 [Candidatus Kaiserbacteria bacterium]|nr:hypothetical protein [Candidatus Kaiserbacteria bacterium]